MPPQRLAITLGIAGIVLGDEMLQLTGIILFSHASFDRILGYGLKYDKGLNLHISEKSGMEKILLRFKFVNNCICLSVMV